MKEEEEEKRRIKTASIRFTGKIISSTLHVSCQARYLYENHWLYPIVEILLLSTCTSFFFFLQELLSALLLFFSINFKFLWLELNDISSFFFSSPLSTVFFSTYCKWNDSFDKNSFFSLIDRYSLKKNVRQFIVYIKNGIKSMHVRMCEAIQVSTEANLGNIFHISRLFYFK